MEELGAGEQELCVSQIEPTVRSVSVSRTSLLQQLVGPSNGAERGIDGWVLCARHT